MKQEGYSIEVYYGKMISIWKEIDKRVANPMKHTEDINMYNEITQKQKLYQFLSGINETYDKDRRDILNKIPLPSMDEAYASIRREISKREIMTSKTSPSLEPSGIGHGLIRRQKKPTKKYPSLGYDNPSGTGGGFITKFRSHRGPTKREEEDKSHLHCTYCGGNKHTKDECFKLIGFPD